MFPDRLILDSGKARELVAQALNQESPTLRGASELCCASDVHFCCLSEDVSGDDALCCVVEGVSGEKEFTQGALKELLGQWFSDVLGASVRVQDIQPWSAARTIELIANPSTYKGRGAEAWSGKVFGATSERHAANDFVAC